jgi:hypothetical protein
MKLAGRFTVIFLLACVPLTLNAGQLVRCTSEDGQSSYLSRVPCESPGEKQTTVTATKPLIPRDSDNTKLIKCTSRDGKTVSIQRGNCASPDDFQQLLP